MSENPDELPGATAPEQKELPSEAREIAPPVVLFDKNFDPNSDESLYDFRPQPVDADEPEPDEVLAPKDLPALESVESSTSQEPTEAESSASPEPTANAEKDSGQPKESGSGSQTSSSQTSAGKTKQPAKT